MTILWTFNFLHKLLAAIFKLRRRRKRREHVCYPSSWRFLSTAVFVKGCLLRLHWWYVFLFYFGSFFFLFSDEKRIFFFQFVLVSPHHEFLVVKMFSNGTMNILLVLEKLRNKIFRLAIAGHLPFKCYVL